MYGTCDKFCESWPKRARPTRYLAPKPALPKLFKASGLRSARRRINRHRPTSKHRNALQSLSRCTMMAIGMNCVTRDMHSCSHRSMTCFNGAPRSVALAAMKQVSFGAHTTLPRFLYYLREVNWAPPGSHASFIQSNLGCPPLSNPPSSPVFAVRVRLEPFSVG